MADTGIGNLHLGGGSCSPYECMPIGATPEQWQAYLDRVGATAQGVGTKPTYDYEAHLGCDLFPSNPIAKDAGAPKMVAGHRAPCVFANSRILDFREVSDMDVRICEGWNNQDSLRRWFFKNMDDIVDGYCLSTVIIPPKHEFLRFYWENMCAIEGLVYDIVLQHSGTVLVAGVDGSVLSSGLVDIQGDDRWSHDEWDTVLIKLVSVPPMNEDRCKPGCGNLDGACIMTSAKLCCPVTGK